MMPLLLKIKIGEFATIHGACKDSGERQLVSISSAYSDLFKVINLFPRHVEFNASFITVTNDQSDFLLIFIVITDSSDLLKVCIYFFDVVQTKLLNYRCCYPSMFQRFLKFQNHPGDALNEGSSKVLLASAMIQLRVTHSAFLRCSFILDTSCSSLLKNGEVTFLILRWFG